MIKNDNKDTATLAISIFILLCLMLSLSVVLNAQKWQEGDRFYDDLQQIVNDIHSRDSAGWVQYAPIVEKIKTTQKYYELKERSE